MDSIRAYHRRRARDEIRAAMESDQDQACLAHVQLAELHLRTCADVSDQRTDECLDCVMANICDTAPPIPAGPYLGGAGANDDIIIAEFRSSDPAERKPVPDAIIIDA